MLGLVHQSINPMITLIAESGGAQILSSANLDAASKRDGLTICGGVGKELRVKITSDYRGHLSEGTVFIADNSLKMSGLSKVAADVRAAFQLTKKKTNE